MCHGDMIRAHKLGMSVKAYRAEQKRLAAMVIPYDANHELRATDEEVCGKTRRFWAAYQLSPTPRRIAEVYKSTFPAVVAADLSDLLRGA